MEKTERYGNKNMTGIDLTCLGINEIRNRRIISGIGTWLSEILDFIIQEKRQKEYILIVNFYAEGFLAERFPGFEMVAIGGACSKLLLKYSHKSTETILNKIGFNSWVVNHCGQIDRIWQPFGIPVLSYKSCKPVLTTVHDFMNCKTEKDHNAYLKLIEEADHVVTVSEYVKKDLLKRYPTIPEAKITAIPNSIVVAMDHMEPCDGISAKYILDINRYEPHKNAKTLLLAFDEYVREYKDEGLELVFAGFGNQKYLNELKSIAREKNIESKVHFFWEISSQKKNWLLKNAAIFVSPSTNEGMGRTPVEAMMCRIPVITTKETSLYEATLGLASYCENPYSISELKCKIRQVLEQERDEDTLGNVACRVKEAYSVKNIWGKYESILRAI